MVDFDKGGRVPSVTINSIGDALEAVELVMDRWRSREDQLELWFRGVKSATSSRRTYTSA